MDIVWLHVHGEIWDGVSKRLQEQKYWKKVIKRTKKPDLFELTRLKEAHPIPREIQIKSEHHYDTLLEKSFWLMDMLIRKTDWKTDRYNNISFHELHYRIRIYFEFYIHALIKEKISLVIFFDTPHMGWDYILYDVAKFLNIKTVILEQSRFPNKFFHFFNYTDYGKFKTSKCLGTLERFPIEKKVEKEWFYMKKNRGQISHLTLRKLLNPEKYVKKIKRLIESNDFLRFIRELFSVSRRPQAFFRFYTERYYKKAIKENIVENYPMNRKFVYFPLHFQPEKNATAWGGVYLDQVLAVERLSQLIPRDWSIYVKENPRQQGAYRNPLFFARLKQIPNTIILPKEADTFEMIKRSQFIATITGTVAFEAITGGKNALMFGWGAWFQNLPGVYHYNDQMDINDLVNNTIDHSQLEQNIAKLLNVCGTGVIREEWMTPVKEFTMESNTTSVAESLVKILNYSKAPPPAAPGPTL